MNQGDRPSSREPDRFFRLSRYVREFFGGQVRKISIDAGFGCPNRGGPAGRNGCVFCDPASFSPSRRGEGGSVGQQIEAAIRQSARLKEAGTFIAYFQPGSNTYAPVEELRRVFEEALRHPQVVGLAIGTRPDCLGEPVLDLLAELHERTWLTTEIGLQTIHERTLRRLNRGHSAGDFFNAAARMRQRGLRFAAHVILGLPGESGEDMHRTAETLARTGLHAVKIHNLYVAKDTPLERLWRTGRWPLPTKAEYVYAAADFLERLPRTCVIERLTGEAPDRYLVAPDWCRHKAAVIQAVEAELRRRGSRQGDRFEP